MIVTIDFISRGINNIVRRLWNPSYTLLTVMSLPFRKHFTNLSMGKHKLDFSIFTVKIAVEKKKRTNMNSKKYHVSYLTIEETTIFNWCAKTQAQESESCPWNSTEMHWKVECAFFLSMKLGKEWLKNCLTKQQSWVERRKRCHKRTGSPRAMLWCREVNRSCTGQWHFNNMFMILGRLYRNSFSFS